MEAKHTKLPWRVAADGREITTSPVGVLEHSKRICDTSSHYKDADEVAANAEFIVRACNSHDDLVRALDSLLSTGEREHIATHSQLEAARAALAKAGAA